jgi:hypothetical protein
VHQNSDPTGSGRGIETYALQPGGEGQKLANNLQEKLIKETGLINRGVKFANFAVPREANMPACLCECGFIGTQLEALVVSMPKYHRQAAMAIGEGLAQYLNVPFSSPAQKLTPKEEIALLVQRGLFDVPLTPEQGVTWGDLAVTLNRLADHLGK